MGTARSTFLVFWGSHPSWIGHKPKVTLHVGIGSVQGRIVDVGLDNPDLRLSKMIRSGTPPEEGKCPFVAIEPGIDVLSEDEADEFVAAVREVMMKAHVLLFFWVSGSYIHPTYPKSTWASSPGDVSILIVTFGLPKANSLPEIALDRGVAYLDTVGFL